MWKQTITWLADTALRSSSQLHWRFMILNSTSPQLSREHLALEMSAALHTAGLCIQPSLWHPPLHYTWTQRSTSEHETGAGPPLTLSSFLILVRYKMPHLEISEQEELALQISNLIFRGVASHRFQAFKTRLCRDTSEEKTLGLMREVSNNRFN